MLVFKTDFCDLPNFCCVHHTYHTPTISFSSCFIEEASGRWRPMQLRPSAMSGTPITTEQSHLLTDNTSHLFLRCPEAIPDTLSFQVLDVTGKWSPLISQWEHGHHLISDILFSPQYSFPAPCPHTPKGPVPCQKSCPLLVFLSHMVGSLGASFRACVLFSAQVSPIPSQKSQFYTLLLPTAIHIWAQKSTYKHGFVTSLRLNMLSFPYMGFLFTNSVPFSHLVMSNSLRPMDGSTQASLFITNSWTLLKLLSIELVMPSSHLILCLPLLLPPSIFPSIRVFSNELVLCTRWPKCWSFTFSISPTNEYSGLISFRMDWLDLLAVQGTLKSLLQHHS